MTLDLCPSVNQALVLFLCLGKWGIEVAKE